MKLSVDDLEAAGLDGLVERLQKNVTENLSGWRQNIAITSEPFAGREVLLDAAEEAIESETVRIDFDGGGQNELPDISNQEAVLLGGCHFLYTRQIGGFQQLDDFLKQISAADTLVVTTWNRYAWDYLMAVRDVGEAFTTRLSVPALTAKQLTDLLTSNYASSMPSFIQTGEAGNVKTLGFRRRKVPHFGDRSYELPLPEINTEYLTAHSLSEDTQLEDTEAVVFEKIAHLSKGNPGVAIALWERSIRDGEIAPTYVEEVDEEFDLSEDEAFVLTILLTKERVNRANVDAVLSQIEVQRVLLNLAKKDLISVDVQEAVINPEYLYAIDAQLKEQNLIW